MIILIIYFILKYIMSNKYIQNKGLKRNTIDKFYTKNNIVELCLNIFKQHIKLDINELIIEPSAGDGSFSNKIKKLTENYIFLDIEPINDILNNDILNNDILNNDILKQDYLKFDYNQIEKKYDKIHIIGNPPFGRQSNMAIKFIKKSCEFCDSISFILPKSFKKDSMKNSIPLNFHNIFEIDLPEKSFTLNDVEYDVPCIFQIWIKKTNNRIIMSKLIENNFEFVKQNEDPHISFRRVGVNAGKIDIITNEKSIQSHYFIKFKNNKSVDENINLLSNVKFDHNNTVGPKSISKQELIAEFNKYL
jgi:hypothetical protein